MWPEFYHRFNVTESHRKAIKKLSFKLLVKHYQWKSCFLATLSVRYKGNERDKIRRVYYSRKLNIRGAGQF